MPFQAIERKLEKTNAEVSDKIPRLFLFDILALDSESLCHLALDQRRTHLKNLVGELESTNGLIQLAKSFPVDPINFERSLAQL